jgi:hypothetical protein
MSNVIAGIEGDQFKVHSTQQLSLGQEMKFIDGRRFRYAKAGAVAVVVAKLYQAPIPIADHVLKTPLAAAVGARSVTLALGGTAVAENQYRDGYVVVDLATNTGFGHIYQVDHHKAIAASGSFAVPLRSPVQVAISTQASSVSLIPNNYAGVILAITTTPTATLAGVSVKPIPIGEFGWIQSAGNCMCLTEDNGAVNVTEGYQLMVGGTTGSLMPQATAVSLTVPNVATCVQAGATTEYSTVCLNRIE